MSVRGRPCQLVVCRGCCCGRKKKRPGVDHQGQLARLSALRDHEGRDIPVRVSTCLGICFKANVVVVQPSSEGRARGGRPVWLGDFLEDRLVDDLDDWIFDGGPGISPLPEALQQHLTSKDAEKPKKKSGKKPKKEKKPRKEKGEKGAARGKAESVKREKKSKKDKRKKAKDGKAGERA
ncbi:hypothetical protein [Marinactinospora thermotolerans]|uniref:hypothetical protein n=1 Tax=Marinactinospora thermotolerans TaxID=531310 RepID=UPI00099A49FD|nr:hypothetical protein [Marinactinospora thermotolerans]